LEEPKVIDFRKRKFIQVTRDVVANDTKLKKASDISVYTVLCMYADNTSKLSWPSVETIAEKSRCSESGVRRSLANLKDAGYIDIRKRYDARGFQTSNQYVLLDVENEENDVLTGRGYQTDTLGVSE
jgi:predicted transcriptional regulator